MRYARIAIWGWTVVLAACSTIPTPSPKQPDETRRVPVNAPQTALVANVNENAPTEPQFRFGYQPAVLRVSVKDPDGSTKTDTAINLLQLSATQTLSYDTRMSYRIFNQSFDLSAGMTDIGQHVSRYGAVVGYQKSFYRAHNLKQWLGAGLALTDDQYTQRYTIASDGYVDKRFSDRARVNFGIDLNTGIEVSINPEWIAGFHIGVGLPLGSNGVRSFNISLSIMH